MMYISNSKMKARKNALRAGVVLLVLAMVFSLTGCSGGSPAPAASEAPGSTDYAPSATEPGDYYEYEYDYDYDDVYSNSEQYSEIEPSAVHYTDEKPEATFSLKVDTASYTNVKRYIESGMLPPSDAVRTEELINWFNYEEELDFGRGNPFAFYTEIGPSPFNDEKLLALVRVGTREVDKKDLPPSNLVFLIDVSGSMNSHDKLPLLQDAFSMLTETLGRDDVVSIVTYASGTGVVLSGARGSDSSEINRAIYNLKAGGSTAGQGGIQLAYEVAEEYFIEGGNNRVILATDGDFNVGISNTNELSRYIANKRSTGVYLSVLGFGTGNIRDDIMETLAKDGNGNYSYIDSLRTAEKVLVNELGANLYTVADDVKAQVVFNPETVYSYKLIGYENRMLRKEDFDDDRKDAGEIGPGSDVIAIFEIEPYDIDKPLSNDMHLFDVRVRYKDPGESESKLIEFPVTGSRLLERNTADFGFATAVAMFGDYLRNDGYGGRAAVRDMIDLAEGNTGADVNGYRDDFIELLYDLRGI